MRERSHRTVDFGADAMVSHLGVNGVGKVERCRAGTKRHDLALGCKDKDLLVEQIDLQRVQVFLGVRNLVRRCPIERMFEPVNLVVQTLGIIGLRRRRSARLLIEPVGGNAVLGLLMHLVGSNLNLERAGRGADNRRMERLVVVDLGHGDIVFEATGHGVPQRMHRAERGVAIAHRMRDDTQCHQVVDLGEFLALALHLLVDGPIVLGTAIDLEALQANAVELVGERLDSLSQIALANLARLSHHARNALVGIGLQVEEGQVLELPLNRAHAQTVGQGRIHVHGLASLKQATVLAKGRQRTHVMQAVGKLNDNDADVLGHGEEHLAQREGLLLVHAVDFDVGELGHAIDELGYRIAKQAGHIGKRGLGILDGIVQQRGAHHIAVHLEIGQNDGHLDGMVNVHLARAALLVAVLLGGKAIGLLHLREVLLIHIFEAQALQLVVAVRHNLGRQLISMLIVLHLRERLEGGIMGGTGCGIHRGPLPLGPRYDRAVNFG